MSTFDPEPKRLSPSRTTLEGMLRDALVNTGATPSLAGKETINPSQPAIPSAHEIAMAIVLASRALGADPIAVARGEPNRNNDHSTSRARTLAAFMLGDRYHLPWRIIARYVGTSESALTVVKGLRLKGQVKWWDERLFRQLCNDLDARLGCVP